MRGGLVEVLVSSASPAGSAVGPGSEAEEGAAEGLSPAVSVPSGVES